MNLKNCNGHMHKLITMLKAKGLGRYITSVPSEIKLRAESWLAGNVTEQTFEPYVAATFEVNAKVMQVCPDLVAHARTVEVCPFCAIEHAHTGMAIEWMDNVTDLTLFMARTNGYPVG